MSTTEFGKLTPEQRKAFEPPVDAWVKPAEKPSIGADWPQYRSHKVVRAGEIRRITSCDGLPGGEGLFDVVVRMAGDDGRPMIQSVRVGADVVAGRYHATEGDFLVRYEPDGYLSVSPRDKFLDGYQPHPPAYMVQAGKLSDEDKSALNRQAMMPGPVQVMTTRDGSAPIEIAMEARAVADALDARDGFMDFGRALYWMRQGRTVWRTSELEGWHYRLDMASTPPQLLWRGSDGLWVPSDMSSDDIMGMDWTVVP